MLLLLNTRLSITRTQPPRLSNSNSFLHRKGAAAGVFTLVGVAIAAILLFILFFLWRRRQRQRLAASGVRSRGNSISGAGHASEKGSGSGSGGLGAGALMGDTREKSPNGHSRALSSESFGGARAGRRSSSTGGGGRSELGGRGVLVDLPQEKPRWSLADFDDYYDGSPRPGMPAPVPSTSSSNHSDHDGPLTRNASSTLSTSHLLNLRQQHASTTLDHGVGEAGPSSAYVLDYPELANQGGSGEAGPSGVKQEQGSQALYTDVPTYGGAYPLQVRKSQYEAASVSHRRVVSASALDSFPSPHERADAMGILRQPSPSMSFGSSASTSHGGGRQSPAHDPHTTLSYYLGGGGGSGTSGPGSSGDPFAEALPNVGSVLPHTIAAALNRAASVSPPPIPPRSPRRHLSPPSSPTQALFASSSPPRAGGSGAGAGVGGAPPRRSTSTQSSAWTATTESSYSSRSTGDSNGRVSRDRSGSSGSRYDDHDAPVATLLRGGAASHRRSSGFGLVGTGVSGPSSWANPASSPITPPDDHPNGARHLLSRDGGRDDHPELGPGLGMGLGLSANGSAVSLSDAVDYSRRVT